MKRRQAREFALQALFQVDNNEIYCRGSNWPRNGRAR